MKRSFMLLVTLAVFASTASCEDTKKLLQMIQKLSAELKEMIAKESKAREVDRDMMLSRIDALSKTKPDAEKPTVKRQPAPLDALLVESYIERLKEGNTRFVKGKRTAQNFAKQRAALASTQQPYAIVLGCSDSRVPPELIFDETLGQLFTVRDAGAVADSAALASIEYATQRLHVKLLVIFGHTSCDALKTHVVAEGTSPADAKVKTTPKTTTDPALAAAMQNVLEQASACRERSTVLRGLIDANELRVVCAVYNLETGEVEFP